MPVCRPLPGSGLGSDRSRARQNVGKEQIAADERRSTLMKTRCLSAFICFHRRPINILFTASRQAIFRYLREAVKQIAGSLLPSLAYNHLEAQRYRVTPCMYRQRYAGPAARF